jgi:hypothetical protein
VKEQGTLTQQVLSETRNSDRLGQPERRSSPRFSVGIEATAVDFSTNASAVGKVTDMGAGGCFVETDRTFSVGTLLGLTLEAEGRSFRCRVLVTHTIKGRGIGLTFIEADPEQGISVLDWVAQLGLSPAR